MEIDKKKKDEFMKAIVYTKYGKLEDSL